MILFSISTALSLRVAGRYLMFYSQSPVLNRAMKQCMYAYASVYISPRVIFYVVSSGDINSYNIILNGQNRYF